MNIFNIIGIVFSIISIPLAIYFYTHRKTRKRIDFIWNHNVLQRRLHDDVTFIYNGSEIYSLAQLTILIFNPGEKELRKTDIPQDFHLKIYSSKKILSTSVVEISSGSIELNISSEEDNDVSVDFNYLNENDGAVLEILYDHDGTIHRDEDGYTYFDVYGDVIGGEKPRKIFHHNYGMFSHLFSDLITRVIVIAVFIGLDIWFFKMEKYGWCVYFTLAILSASFQLYREFPTIRGKRFPQFAKNHFNRS